MRSQTLLELAERRHAVGKAGMIIFSVLCSMIASPGTAMAGCGCDHPPPVRGEVYPRFGSPGRILSVYSEAVGDGPVCVKIDGQPMQQLPRRAPHTLEVKVPQAGAVGPQALKIFNRECSAVASTTAPVAVLPARAFTKLPPAIPVSTQDGTRVFSSVVAAVDADGVLMVPFDISAVREATQFYITFLNRPLRFTADDLVYYNADEYNLKLFQNLVASPNDYQWGPYYGSTVVTWLDGGYNSDTIEYWRHEFYTYANAHLPGGTHEVQPDGVHPDGTLHVDHDHLVLTVQALESTRTLSPYNKAYQRALPPGALTVDVAVSQEATEKPTPMSALSHSTLSALAGATLGTGSTVGTITSGVTSGTSSTLRRLLGR